MALAPGFEQQSDGALKGEADLTGRLPGVLVVDEHPVRRLLGSSTLNRGMVRLQ